MSKDFQNGFALGRACGGVVVSEGTKLNIAYGETPPEDTSKLWIKANEPENVSVGSDIEGVESIGYMDVNLPVSISGVTCAKVGNNVYIFGYGKEIYKFDMETREFSTLSATYQYYSGVAVAVVGEKIYLFGGQYYSSSYSQTTGISVFDTETETITKLSTALPEKNASMGCVSIGTKIYLFGGHYSISSSQYFKDAIRVFDTETETLTTLTTKLPFGCGGMACGLVGNKIYLFGGSVSKSSPYYTNKILAFDIGTETITTLDTTIPEACVEMGCGVIGTKIYLFGGYVGSAIDTINVFDTETETITTLDTTLLNALHSMGTVTIGNKIYLFGGSGDGYTVKVFTLTHELAQGDIEIQSGLLNNKFNLINTDNAQVEIGIENVYIGDKNNEAETANAFLYINGEWMQISFGRDQFAPEEPTGTYAERMYEHFGVDSTEYPYLLIKVYGTIAQAYFFKGRETDALGNYDITNVRDLQITIDEGADISAIIGAFESRNSSALGSEVNRMGGDIETENDIYYANFNYAELGYSGIGTWETLEQGGDSDG